MGELCTKLRSPDSSSIFLLVSHRIMACDIPKFAPKITQPVVITDLWVERCLHRQEVVDPKMNCTSTPFPKFPLTGMFFSSWDGI